MLYEVITIIREELNDLDPTVKSELGFDGKFKPGLSKNSASYFLFKRLSYNFV